MAIARFEAMGGVSTPAPASMACWLWSLGPQDWFTTSGRTSAGHWGHWHPSYSWQSWERWHELRSGAASEPNLTARLLP